MERVYIVVNKHNNESIFVGVGATFNVAKLIIADFVLDPANINKNVDLSIIDYPVRSE